MDRSVKGKIVAVTGGANGLGLAMVTNFLDEEAELVIILDLNEKKGQETVADLKKKYGDERVVFYKCNVTTDLESVFQIIIDNHKYVDILINNAGILDERNIKRTMDINTMAVMEWTMKFYEHMRTDKKGRGGTIINVSSIFGYRIIPFTPFYQGSKFAVLGFTKSIGHESNFKRSGVRVVALCPGLTHTELANDPHAWEDAALEELLSSMGDYEWQQAPAVGKGAVEIYKQATSGSAWVVEGSRSAEKLK